MHHQHKVNDDGSQCGEYCSNEGVDDGVDDEVDIFKFHANPTNTTVINFKLTFHNIFWIGSETLLCLIWMLWLNFYKFKKQKI